MTMEIKIWENHTKILFKKLKIPIKVNKKKNYDLIKVKGVKDIKSLNYNIPSDISSSSFFIVLTALSKNSKLRYEIKRLS